MAFLHEKPKVSIDKNVPFPGWTSAKGKRSKYPWYELKPGESFVYDGTIIQAQSAAVYYSNKLDRVFKARTLNEEPRVWRIE